MQRLSLFVAHCGGDSTFMSIYTPESQFANLNLWVQWHLNFY